MKSTYVKIALFVLTVGLLTACGSQAANTPASSPTEAVAPATEAPTNLPLPTDTALATEAAAATEPASQGATVSFAHDIVPIIESRCINCHGGQRTEKGLDLTTFDGLMAGSENGPVLTPGDAADSKFVELVANQKMPKRGPKLTPPQIELFTEWVNQGALNN
jgi:uncharacterized membrane protein